MRSSRTTPLRATTRSSRVTSPGRWGSSMAKKDLPAEAGSHRRAGSHGKVGVEPRAGEPVSSLLPDRPTLPKVRDIAAGCKACDLYKRGTQTVFGEGPRKATVMLVGEQPGDAEDLAGHPFVGPAGKLLD